MNAAMYKVLSGAITQERRLEAVTENLANVNTSGYKGGHLAFAEVLAGMSAPQKGRTGGLVAVDEYRIDFSQGALQQTDNPLDLAIDGDGFFVIDTPRGPRYTRQGIFSVAADGTVVTPLGEPLLGDSGPLRVVGKDVQVTPDGVVITDGEEMGRIQVVRFPSPHSLEKEGHGLFRPSPSAGPEATTPTPSTEFSVLQGHIEEANVTPVEALVALMTTQRQFEVYTRAMKTMDTVTERVLTDAARL